MFINFPEGHRIRIRPNHPSIKLRGDVGTVQKYIPVACYEVLLQENGLVIVEENQIEDIRAIEWRNR